LALLHWLPLCEELIIQRNQKQCYSEADGDQAYAADDHHGALAPLGVALEVVAGHTDAQQDVHGAAEVVHVLPASQSHYKDEADYCEEHIVLAYRFFLGGGFLLFGMEFLLKLFILFGHILPLSLVNLSIT